MRNISQPVHNFSYDLTILSTLSDRNFLRTLLVLPKALKWPGRFAFLIKILTNFDIFETTGICSATPQYTTLMPLFLWDPKVFYCLPWKPFWISLLTFHYDFPGFSICHSSRAKSMFPIRFGTSLGAHQIRDCKLTKRSHTLYMPYWNFGGIIVFLPLYPYCCDLNVPLVGKRREQVALVCQNLIIFSNVNNCFVVPF